MQSFTEAIQNKYSSESEEESFCVIYVPKGAPGAKGSMVS